MSGGHSAALRTRSKYHPGEIARRMYDWVAHWAETKYAAPALFLISFAEASFFPIPPDVLLIAMGVGAPKRSLWFATITLVGSVLGAWVGYSIGLGLWAVVDQFFFSYVPNFTPELFAKVTAAFNENAFISVFTFGFTPIPFKIITIAAGVAEINFLIFTLSAILSRGLRFYLVGGSLYFFGPKMKVYIEKYFDWLAIGFTLLAILGIAALKLL